MLSLQPSTSSPSRKSQPVTPNLLPAHIHHNGPIPSTSTYWKPSTDPSDASKSHAYFRGRHLHGTTLPLPEKYTGAVVRVTERDAPKSARIEGKSGVAEEEAGEDGDMEGDEEMEDVEVKVAEKIGQFEEIVVWGHGGTVEAESDVYVRGMREWISFAEAANEEEDGDEQTEKKG